MLALNSQLFLLINASAQPYPTTVGLAELAASGVIFLVPILLVGLWIWGDPKRRPGLVATAIAATVALSANQLLGLLWFEPRPFMVGLGRTLITHPPENSFPSDHTTFMLAVGIGLIATRASPAWGKVVVILGLVVAWSRIYLGLHFPVDMLASALVGGSFGAVATLLTRVTARYLMPLIEPVYDAGLRLLHLPARLFPRKT
ncbi:MAG: phosphatase PAP2 family protein [Rhodopseudomonas sp.]|nr:phosphatase PAP2 family protein [Rhodopseudomonas sp.]